MTVKPQFTQRQEDVMAPPEIIRPNGECYGHRVQRSPSPFGLAVEEAPQEKSHHESKTGNYCLRRIGAHCQWGECTTQDRWSNERSASVAYIRASLWVCLARDAAIPVTGRPLRIVFTRTSIVSK